MFAKTYFRKCLSGTGGAFFWGKAAPSMEGLPQARRSGTKWSGDQALAGPGTRLAKQFAPKRIIKINQKKADKIVCQKKKIIKK